MAEPYVTSKGVAVEFVPIAMLIDQIESDFRKRQPPRPFYEVPTAFGAVEKHPLDELKTFTPEQKAQLDAYHEKRRELAAERQETITKTYIIAGCKFEMPPDDSWMENQKFLGITIPEHPQEKKLHWFKTEALGTLQDLQSIMAGVSRASGASEEDLQQAEDTFRRAVGSAGRDAAAGLADPEGPDVVLESPVRGRDGRLQDGKVSKRVRRRKPV